MKRSNFPIRRTTNKKKRQKKSLPNVRTIDSRFNLEQETLAAKSNHIARTQKTDFSTIMKTISPWDYPMGLDFIIQQKPPSTFDITKSARINEYGKW